MSLYGNYAEKDYTMTFKEAIISLEEIKQYFLDLLVKLPDDQECMKGSKFGVMVLNAYCAVGVACNQFRPVNGILFCEENAEVDQIFD